MIIARNMSPAHGNVVFHRQAERNWRCAIVIHAPDLTIDLGERMTGSVCFTIEDLTGGRDLMLLAGLPRGF